MSEKTGDLQHTLRLNVYISRQGQWSRRKAFDLVKEGHVRVNGQTVREPSFPVKARGDRVEVDGEVLDAKPYRYLMLNKPRGVVTTKSDRFASTKVTALLPPDSRELNPVGRLDKDSEGLLLFTNDGDLLQKLTHPRFCHDKRYEVVVKGLVDEPALRRLEQGIVIEGQKTLPAKICDVRHLKNRTRFVMTLREGRKRQIRLMCAAVGHAVTALKRIQQGPLTLGRLRPGECRPLTKREIDELRKL